MIALLSLALAVDVDGDGWHLPDDCDDTNAAIHPGAGEECEDQEPQIDDDCDGSPHTYTDPNTGVTDTVSQDFNYYPDADGDGFGDKNADPEKICRPFSGYSTAPVDCDDSDANVYPGQTEYCNGIDDDCDGAVDNDDATDIDPAVSGCTDFCRDADGDIHGDADLVECLCTVDTCADGKDNDNDGVADDNDPDCASSGRETSTYAQPYVDAGVEYVEFSNYFYITECTDCFDQNADIYPGAPERHTGRDDDCDGRVAWTEADCDSDGWRLDEPATACTDDQDVACWSGTVPATCDATTGWLMVDLGGRTDSFKDATDCDDQDGSIHPEATDIPDDGIDQDCDGADAVWVDTAVLDSPGPDSSAPPDDDKDHGCNCGTPGPGPWVLALLLAMARRTRFTRD